MSRTSLSVVIVVLLPALSGCGGGVHPVTGTVKLKGKPVEGCKVILLPETAGEQGGFGVTDKSGKFEIQSPQGEKGMKAGKYKVGFIAWVNARTGKPVPPDAKPSEVEGGVKNIFGDKYESPSMSPESLEVRKGGTAKDFDITP